jgi:hypothetical protein
MQASFSAIEPWFSGILRNAAGDAKNSASIFLEAFSSRHPERHTIATSIALR